MKMCLCVCVCVCAYVCVCVCVCVRVCEKMQNGGREGEVACVACVQYIYLYHKVSFWFCVCACVCMLRGEIRITKQGDKSKGGMRNRGTVGRERASLVPRLSPQKWGRREPGNIRGKSCRLPPPCWRYQSDCRMKSRVQVTFCPLSKKLSTQK